ncbi:MAG: hypothetical protein Q9191_006735 [Dirinaria sp. TL-2023a]
MAMQKDEQTFKEMWKEARIKFEELTDKSLVQSKNRSLDDVLRELNKRFNPPINDENRKQQRVKELASNVLKFIQLLGGIAAQGASAVFGPANMCFNAMHFLIDIPVRVSKFYDDLALLFEEISTFMQQFKIYQRIEQFATVDIELKRSTHKLMIMFVDVCAISIDVLSGSKLKTWKKLTKLALFDNDSGIAAKLDEFRRLIDHQSQISDAVTLEHVLKSEAELSSSMRNVVDILNKAAEDSRQLLEAKSQEIQDELKDTHDDVRTVKAGTEVLVNDVVDRSSMKKNQDYYDLICKKFPDAHEKFQTLEKDFDQIRNNSLQNTGSWLEGNDVYKQWADFESEDSLLLLGGKSGCGKSHLAIAILDSLKKRHNVANDDSMRVSLASYRFQKPEKPSRDDAIKDALKCIAVQIAKQNLVYRKNLSSYLESKDLSFLRDLSVQDFFKDLIPPPNMKDTQGTAYVLLFDGLDQLSADVANQLLAAIFALESAKTRSMVIGTDEFFQSCLKSQGRSLDVIPNIRIVDHNVADVKSFIDSELQACQVLQGDAREIIAIKNTVREKLPDIVEGNFNEAKQIIERVSEGVESEKSVEDIKKLVSEETLMNKDAATERLVKDLNESLNAQEIEQLNELLIWTIYAYKYLSVDEMRAALYLRTKRTPLQSLEDKVARKYSKLLQIDTDNNNTFWMKNDYLEDFFVKSKRQKQEIDTNEVNDPRISMTITIDHVKLSKIQRFFWDLSEKIVLDKFAFTSSLTGPNDTVKIGANKTESHLLLVRRCFDLLLGEPVEETKILCEYALINLLTHLHFLLEEVASGLLESIERVNIVDELVILLQSPDCIERHLTERYFWQRCWLDPEWELQTIQLWLCDSEAMSRLNRKGLSWLKKVQSAGRLSALKDIAAMIARHWLCFRTWPAELPFQWIDTFLGQSVQDEAQPRDLGRPLDSGDEGNSRQEDENKHPGEAPTSETTTFGARVLRAAEWAESEVKIAKDSLWYERLGNTLLHYEEFDRAKEAYSRAKELPDCFWMVSKKLAKTYAMSNQKGLAVQEMDVAIAHFREKVMADDEKAELIKCLLKSANWQVELQSFADATQRLREAIQIDEHHHRSHYELLKVFVATEQKIEALKILSDMAARTVEGDSLTQLASMFLEFPTWDYPAEYFETVFGVAKDDDMFQVVLGSLHSALTFAQESGESSRVVDLLLWQGVALAWCETEENHRSALVRWRECCKLGIRLQDWSPWDSAFAAARHLFSSLYVEAQSVQSTTSDLRPQERELNKLLENTNDAYAAQRLRLSLASLYRLQGKQGAAQKLLLNDMKSGIDLLSDDDPENDVFGYSAMANILMHTGDDLNALSAWSLFGPNARYTKIDTERTETDENNNARSEASAPIEELPSEGEQAEYLGYSCDGRCNKSLTYADNVWFCKVCDDIQFHDECLDKLRKGTLTRFVCNKDHEWLRVPSWIDEYRATGKNRVRVGGELQDGKRIGGQIVAVDEFVDMIREKWGIEKPPKEPSTGDQDEGNATETENSGDPHNAS